jgi:hypothetical protein
MASGASLKGILIGENKLDSNHVEQWVRKPYENTRVHSPVVSRLLVQELE